MRWSKFIQLSLIDCVYSAFQYIQKLNRQERVVEEVKHVLKPHFLRKYITKDDYKEIMKKSVSKVSGWIVWH